MERHDRDLRDHAKTLTSIVEKLTLLEMNSRQRELSEARAEERAIARGEKLDRIESEILAIRAAGAKLLWIVIGSVVLAFLAFVYQGGLAI